MNRSATPVTSRMIATIALITIRGAAVHVSITDQRKPRQVRVAPKESRSFLFLRSRNATGSSGSKSVPVFPHNEQFSTLLDTKVCPQDKQ